MTKYEIMTIVNANLTQEEKDAALKEVSDAITSNKGKVINNQVWLDKYKFPFLMKKCTHGTYHLTNFEGGNTIVESTKKVLKLNEKVLRALIVRAKG